MLDLDKELEKITKHKVKIEHNASNVFVTVLGPVPVSQTLGALATDNDIIETVKQLVK